MRLLILVSLYSSPPINIRICPIFRMAQYLPGSGIHGPASSRPEFVHVGWQNDVSALIPLHFGLRLLSLSTHLSLLTGPFPLAALATRHPELFGSLALSL